MNNNNKEAQQLQIEQMKKVLDEQSAALELMKREATIEVALEKVRARTMAMQKSDELPEAANNLFLQVQALGMPAWSAGYCIWDEGKQGITLWMSSEGVMQPSFHAPLTEDPSFIHMKEAYERGDAFHVEEVGGEALVTHYQYMRTLPVVGEILDSIIAAGHPLPTFQIFHCVNFSQGFLLFITYEPVPKAHEIFKRFGKVFDQTYTRFLDLQKAEAQARESQIEAALEKVRSRSLAMHKSTELKEVANTVFRQLKDLNIETNSASIYLLSEHNTGLNIWIGMESDMDYYTESMHIPVTDHPVMAELSDAIKSRKSFIAKTYNYEEKNKIWNYLFEHSDFKIIPDERKKSVLDSEAYTVSIALLKNTGIQLNRFSKKFFSEKENEILQQFSKVFEQAYTRFLDLQKAEVQAREAQIEAALEKVRSRSLAMHNSSELREVVKTVFEKLQDLNFSLNDGAVSILIFKEGSKDHIQWIADPGQTYATSFEIAYTDHPLCTDIITARESGLDYLSKIYSVEEKNDYFKYLFEHSEYKRLPDEVKKMILGSEHYGISLALTKNSAIVIPTNSGRLLTENEKEILKRFAKVFEQSFTRFLDLQKAEAQAREATIEAALERVRARTMAMHSSEDVVSATSVLLIELGKLGIKTLRCGILIIEENETFEVWSVTNTAEGKTIRSINTFDINDHPLWQAMYKGWKQKDEFFYYHLAGEEKKAYYRILSNKPNYLSLPVDELPDQNFQGYNFPEGTIWTFSLQPHSEEDKQVMKRFTAVFSLTFRRYRDLQKAEDLAREATIEAALEKVRGKAMAMHNSNDLIATASIVFTELRKLGITPMRCGVGILNKESRKALLYSATASEEGDSLSLVGWVLLDVNPVLRSVYDSWIRSEDYFPVLKKEMLKAYYEHLKLGFEVPDEHTNDEQHGYFLAFSEGNFYGWSEMPFTESEIKILKRFTNVIDLTFRRYIELQKSEANTREAVRSASLDRVRAETASMRTTKDLEIITPLIWNELTTLGLPFIRCGVFIMDEQQQLVHIHLSTPDGKAIAAFHLPYTTPGNIGKVLNSWQHKKIYADHWSETDFIVLANTLVQQGFIDMPEQYLKTLPPGGFYLHFLPFLQGMLYVGNTTMLSEDDTHLIQSVADAFSTAYARYEDFNKLELAKEQIEKTLVDLKQAQAQLVQSEKMASLGELTAGIAHEIQNPLNFVNNFSEVSNELLDEMKAELAIGNKQEAIMLADDVKQNLEKILHHGKRADAIVKGMLQHSRTSTATKEPTNINALADEYLRLAYHGLRAKDKSFNATLKTDFDESIGNINIIPQDIGRVLLNLYNNAFYAVNERSKHHIEGYEPTVAVSTKKMDDKIFISVKDNGNGIPQKVLDKIFQPFFTTKPTGQGTGLGLSLAYDIVKAHGGEIKINTIENDQTEFIITLPIV